MGEGQTSSAAEGLKAEPESAEPAWPVLLLSSTKPDVEVIYAMHYWEANPDLYHFGWDVGDKLVDSRGHVFLLRAADQRDSRSPPKPAIEPTHELVAAEEVKRAVVASEFQPDAEPIEGYLNAVRSATSETIVPMTVDYLRVLYSRRQTEEKGKRTSVIRSIAQLLALGAALVLSAIAIVAFCQSNVSEPSVTDDPGASRAFGLALQGAIFCWLGWGFLRWYAKKQSKEPE